MRVKIEKPLKTIRTWIDLKKNMIICDYCDKKAVLRFEHTFSDGYVEYAATCIYHTDLERYENMEDENKKT